MFKKIAGTIGTKMVTAILALATWILNANFLTPEKVGTISLIIFSVAIIQLFTNFVAGAALIYQTPRTGIYKLFIPAYIWTFLITILLAGGLACMAWIIPSWEVIPAGYYLPVLALALVMSFSSANFMLLLGLERVKTFNLISLVQIIVLFSCLLLVLFVFRFYEVMGYFWAIFISHCIALLLGLIALFPSFRKVPLTGMRSLMNEIFRFGTYVQVANIFQTMNYRLSLKFVDHYLGRGVVGVLSLGMQLAEGMWLISRSIATVQYSRIANEPDGQYSARLTLTLAKITLVATGIGMVLLLAIPESLFTTIFSRNFSGVKLVILSLAPGIVALSMSMIFSGYFSGTNKPFHNAISSALGFLFTIVMSLILIPRYGLAGAGISATVSYSVLTIYQLIIFIRITNFKLNDFLLTFSELKQLLGELRKPTH